MAELILVLGGARSGKSRFALRLARERGGRLVYVATCRPRDEEMRRRVELHRRCRSPTVRTVEVELELAEALDGLRGQCEAAIVDCLTLWISNLMLSGRSAEAILAELDRLLALERDYALILVSNEVGCGVVPVSRLGRAFRDLVGLANQRVAERSDRVYLMVAGLPLLFKG